MRRWDSANAPQLARDPTPVKGLIGWEFRFRHAAVPERPSSRRDRPPRGGIRARPERAHRAKPAPASRCWSKPSTCWSAGAPAPIWCARAKTSPRFRPSSRRPIGREVIVRREISAQGRSRAFIDDALATATALRDLGEAVVDLHGQHEHQALLDPAEHVDLLDAFAGHADARRGRRGALRRLARRRATRCSARSSAIARSTRASRSRPSSCRRSRRSRPRPAKTRRSAPNATCSRTPIASAGCPPRPTPRSTRATRPPSASLAGVWKRLADLAVLDPRCQPHLDQRDDIKSAARRPGVLPARLSRRPRRVARSPAGRRGSAGGDRTAEAALRPGAGGRARAGRGAPRGTGGPRRERRAGSAPGDRRARDARPLRRRGPRARRRPGGRRGAARARARARTRGTGHGRLPRSTSASQPIDDPERWTRGGTDDVEFFFSPNPGEDVRPLARIASGGELSRFMLALRLLDHARRGPARRSSSTKWTRASAARPPTRSARACRRWAAATRCCASRTSRRSRRARTRTSRSSSTCGPAARTRPLIALEGADREREVGPHDRRRGRVGEGDRVGARVAGVGPARRTNSESRRRRQAPRASRKGPAVARKYFVETFGCQMNYHDSERIAGLLERDGLVAASSDADADVVVINTCSVRERAEEKLYTRLGELRELAKSRAARRRDRRHRLRRPAGRRASPGPRRVRSTSSSAPQGLKRVCRGWSRTRPTGVGRPSTSARTTTCRFRWASPGTSDPVRAWVTIIEGCNEFCSFCVVPYTRGHERMRPVADILAEVAAAADGGRFEIQLLGQIVNHYQAPDDPACDFAELLARVSAVGGVRRVRFASPHPRHVTRPADRRHPRSAEGLQAPAPAGAVRLGPRPRRDAAAVLAGGVS